MSSDSLAALRKGVGPDLASLAEQHFQHDLQQSDRDALRSAASSLRLHATLGSALGVAAGILAAVRLRRARAGHLGALRTAERPTHVRFGDGREEALPDLAPLLLRRPSRAGDAAAGLLLGTGGLFLGGEVGLLSGGWSARRTIQADAESRRRIEAAFRRFRADVLRREADALEGGRGGLWVEPAAT